MATRLPKRDTKPRQQSNRDWLENNQDRQRKIGLTLPTNALDVWRQAGEKAGVSMSGLMLAVMDFLQATDGPELAELAKRQAKRYGVRMQYHDLNSGAAKRVSVGRYGKPHRHG